MRSVELFAGCGGLALGLSRAGFKHSLVVELNEQANITLTKNKRLGVEHMSDWPLCHADIRDVDFRAVEGEVDLVAGGPPCQPFSIGGKHCGPDDSRNLWPEAVRAVRELRPKAFLFENVRGLLRPAFSEYLSYLKLYLAWPGMSARDGEAWSDHLGRLRKHESARRRGGADYRVIFQGINTADFGAPQKRHRAIAVGIRTDMATEWKFPEPTHSREALAWTQYVTGDYWKRHGLASSSATVGCCEDNERFLRRVQELLLPPSEDPWVTVRDALQGLPEPSEGESSLANHELHPGARIYPRHTGSRWDEPAKALKAGNHGVPGGENILAPGDGTFRYFTLREMARLQGFPDEFIVQGTWKGPIKQLGNAVPVQVGEILGRKIIRIVERGNDNADNAVRAAA